MFEHNVPKDPFEDLDKDEDEENVEDIRLLLHKTLMELVHLKA